MLNPDSLRNKMLKFECLCVILESGFVVLEGQDSFGKQEFHDSFDKKDNFARICKVEACTCGK
jgi:hypothetical protein